MMKKSQINLASDNGLSVQLTKLLFLNGLIFLSMAFQFAQEVQG
jgi:hypothetical protein